MLIETIAVIALISPISASAWSLRKDVEKKWQILVLYVGPIIDAWFVWLLMDWLGFGFVATWGCTISAGIISNLLIQPILSPRRLMVFRLSWQQVVRRPRQAALMMAGLLVASSIITSSLVIGDSLDATLSKEVEAVYGDTDILIFQKDRRTGFSFDMDVNLTTSFGSNWYTAGYSGQMVARYRYNCYTFQGGWIGTPFSWLVCLRWLEWCFNKSSRIRRIRPIKR